MHSFLYVLTFTAALGSGLLAGLFFAFSAFVMTALARIPAEQGMAAMQSINTTIVRSLFMPVFMGTTILSIVIGVASMFDLGTNVAALYALAGSLLVVVGTFVVTAVFNVPLNNALAAAAPGSPEGVRVWEAYNAKWLPWNHVRTLTSIGALACFVAALCKW